MTTERTNPTVDSLAKIDQWMQRLADETDQAAQSAELTRYLTTLSRFYTYSSHNCALIVVQRPDATRVAGYRAWQALGRQVKKGATGIAILCPALIKGKTDAGHDSPERQHLVSRYVCYHLAMGMRNYLIEGVSGTGKTSACKELQRRGYYALNGDRALAYQGDPETGKPLDGLTHEHHIWHVDKVKALVANHDEAITFFCGGSRNFSKFIDLFDGVFVLDVDLDTLNRRLDERPENEWGGRRTERELIAQLHQTKEDTPKNGIIIDATAPIARVVDEILRQVARS